MCGDGRPCSMGCDEPDPPSWWAVGLFLALTVVGCAVALAVWG